MDGLANDLDKFWRVLRFSYPAPHCSHSDSERGASANNRGSFHGLHLFFFYSAITHWIDLTNLIWKWSNSKFKFSEISSSLNFISQPRKAFMHRPLWPLWPSWLVMIFPGNNKLLLGQKSSLNKHDFNVWLSKKQFSNPITMHFSSLWIGWSSKIVNAMMVLEGAAGPSFNQTTKPPRTSAPPCRPCAPCPPSGPWRPARAARAVI